MAENAFKGLSVSVGSKVQPCLTNKSCSLRMDLSYSRNGYRKTDSFGGESQGENVHYNLKFKYEEVPNLDPMFMEIHTRCISAAGVLNFEEKIILEPLTVTEINLVLGSNFINIDNWNSHRIQTDDNRMNQVETLLPAIQYFTTASIQKIQESSRGYYSKAHLIMEMGCGTIIQQRKFSTQSYHDTDLELETFAYNLSPLDATFKLIGQNDEMEYVNKFDLEAEGSEADKIQCNAVVKPEFQWISFKRN